MSGFCVPPDHCEWQGMKQMQLLMGLPPGYNLPGLG